MEIFDFVIALVLAVAGGAAGAAVINGMNERWKFRARRLAVKEDRAAQKEDRTDELSEKVDELEKDEEVKNRMIEGRLEKIEKQLNAVAEAQKVVLLDRILYLGQSYIDKGVISYDDRKRFHDMHKSYHDGLGGNGDADLIVKGVDELPLKH